ncbi:MAG: ATP-grasp domain-containing protein [Bacteroidales bacterium]|nr:ATP-grasp domain-containing protein [Bacteroidales bacterium]
MKKIIILHNEIDSGTPDELDVLDQRDLIESSCLKMGLKVECMTVGKNIYNDLMQVSSASPDVVFNLVESTWGKGELIYFAPAILNALKIPYTGVPLDALFVTTNKVLAKKIMRLNGLPTAGFFSVDEIENLNPDKSYIVKPIWEEASVGINADSVFKINETEKLNRISALSSSQYFIEEFISGREFNVSILAGNEGEEVLYPAEMIFSSYFDDKPKIVGYKAKWDEHSEEYRQTNRAFGTLEQNLPLKTRLIEACRKSWNTFNLHGYARVDFRVDEQDNVFILEINGNPCISPDSGFVAALEYAGYTREMMIKRILNDLN